jgi:hypothetical protein
MAVLGAAALLWSGVALTGTGAVAAARGAAIGDGLGEVSVSCASAGNCAAGGTYADVYGQSQGFVLSERHGVWGRAVEVPGLRALNRDGVAGVTSVSCASAGNCAAGGSYADRAGHAQGFVVSERNGVWGQAVEVPGLGVLNAGGNAFVGSVSCASAGNCAAGGTYAGSGGNEGFVVSERNGVWGQAVEVPGLDALGAGPDVGVSSLSCASAGNCAGGGFYETSMGIVHGFLVSQRGGVWGQAIQVPGLGLNARALSLVASVSCVSAGDCMAGGSNSRYSSWSQGFVVRERHGVWGRAIEVPGLRILNAGGDAGVASVSCASARECAAGGTYAPGAEGSQGFVVSERDGVWGRATEVPGLGALNAGGRGGVGTVSCASAGDCAAGGSYAPGAGSSQGFVVSERDGVWGQAIEVPGLGAVNAGWVDSVSCGSAGDCAASGISAGASGEGEPFVVSEHNGVWQRAIKAPGLRTYAGGLGVVTSLSCAPAGYCAAAGGEFLVSQRNGTWGQAIVVPGLIVAGAGRGAAVTAVSCTSAGNCGAGGSFSRPTSETGFVVSERNGVWGRAIEVPGLHTLNKTGVGAVSSVSCASAGNCAAGGFYRDASTRVQGFVVSERNGVWGRAIEVAGLGALNTYGDAGVRDVSCASAGDCAAGGTYNANSSQVQGFVVSERNGVWGRAIEVPGLAAMDGGRQSQVYSLSCGSAGYCATGGYYADRRGAEGFVASERNGVWGQAIEVPLATISSVSCVSASYCLAGGSRIRKPGGTDQGFVMSERKGVWGKPVDVPGLRVLDAGESARLNSLSCVSAGNCAAGGNYDDRSGHLQGFVASERNGTWHWAIEVPGLGTLNTGGNAQVYPVSCGSAGNCAAGGYYVAFSGSYHGFVDSEQNSVWRRAFVPVPAP